MKLPQAQIKRRERPAGPQFDLIDQENRANQQLIQSVAGVAESYIKAESTAEFISGKANATDEVNRLHIKLNREMTPVSDLADIGYDEKDVKDIGGEQFVPTYLVGDKLWSQETDRIYNETTSGFKHQLSKNEFNARWADAKTASRDVTLKQMEAGAKSYHRRTKEGEINEYLSNGNYASALESVHFLEAEQAYNAEEAKAKRNFIGKYAETSNVYDLVNTEDVEAMQAEKARLRDKDGSYTGPHDAKERASLISVLDRGINEQNALKNTSFSELSNSAADYSANRLSVNDSGYNPEVRAKIEAFSPSTPSQATAKSRALRELDIVDRYADKAGLIRTASPDGAAEQYSKALADTANIKDYRARAAAENHVRAVYSQRMEMLRTDPARYAVETNDGVGEAYANFAAGLQGGADIPVLSDLYNAYKAKSQSTQEAYGVSNIAIFPAQMSAGLNASLQGTTVSDKFNIAQRFAAIGGADVDQIAREIGGDNPAFTQGMMELQGNNPNIVNAEAIFRGMEVDDTLPEKRWNESRYDAFANMNISDADSKQASDAMRSWYLGMAATDQLKEFDDNLWSQAKEAIMGPTVDPGGNRTKDTISYKDDTGNWVSPSDFNSVLNRVDNDDLLNAQGVSIRVGGSTDAREIIENSDLIPVGDGVYKLAIQNSAATGTNYGSGVGVVKDSDGNDFVLDMRKVTNSVNEGRAPTGQVNIGGVIRSEAI